ncbi:TRAPP subunit, partial [Ascosphaera acerosa]
AGGDGVARFRFPDASRYMNQFMVHASLDVLEEVQWTNGAMYLKHIDTYSPSSCYISAFVTGSGARFLLLHQPHTGLGGAGHAHAHAHAHSSSSSSDISASGAGSAGGTHLTHLTSRASAASVANNPTAPQTEEAVRQFMLEVYDGWVKTVMSPFCKRDRAIASPVFRQRVVAAGRKWL